MNPHTLDFKSKISPLNPRNSPKSPLHTPKRTALGQIQNSPSYLSKSSSKISRIFEERSRFTMSNKENSFFCSSERYSSVTKRVDLEGEGSTQDSALGDDSCPLDSPLSAGLLQKSKSLKKWTLAKVPSESPNNSLETPRKILLGDSSQDSGYANSAHKLESPLLLDDRTVDFTDILQATTSYRPEKCETVTSKTESFVPHALDQAADLEPDFETLHDLEDEFDSDNFDRCSKYEIISTDSPNIISRGSSTRKVTSKNFVFGAPISETEQSTSFNRPNPSATRMLNFDNETSFEFTSPAALRTSSTNMSVKKALNFDESPPKTNALRHERSDSSIGSMSTISPLSHRSEKTRLRLYTSESTTSMESGFVSEIEDVFLFDSIEADTLSSPQMANFGALMSGQIKDGLLPVAEESMELSPKGRPALFRSVSLNPELERARTSLLAASLESPVRAFKRPEPPTLHLEDSAKRRRSDLCPPRPVLQRALSENAASIMSALARSASNPDLIGDFSRPFTLPLMHGPHPDLKAISCDTLAALLRGDTSVTNFQVIDCRYPYEYTGGHIRGAANLFTTQQVSDLVQNAPEHSVLVFHCELSLERGPKLSRFLRSTDRAKNKENYPSLHYPEVYLLHEGYRAFYAAHPSLCEPRGYTPMLDPEHRADLSVYRASQPTTTTLKKSLSVDESRRGLQRQKSRSRLLL